MNVEEVPNNERQMRDQLVASDFQFYQNLAKVKEVGLFSLRQITKGRPGNSNNKVGPSVNHSGGELRLQCPACSEVPRKAFLSFALVRPCG